MIRLSLVNRRLLYYLILTLTNFFLLFSPHKQPEGRVLCFLVYSLLDISNPKSQVEGLTNRLMQHLLPERKRVFECSYTDLLLIFSIDLVTEILSNVAHREPYVCPCDLLRTLVTSAKGIDFTCFHIVIKQENSATAFPKFNAHILYQLHDVVSIST